MCLRAFVPLLALLPVVLFASAQEIKPRPVDELKRLPIALGQGEIVEKLRAWWREGTAAGNVDDWYDNRDDGHSPLDLRPYPQLQKVHYTLEMAKARVHWAAQRRLLPIVVFGNSSTSAPPTSGGSNPRQYYVSTNGLEFLAAQYAKNNLYIYPEHRDHDPGHNGRGLDGDEGYGDLYPTNTPYLIISQGSSGSDQPFMRAIPYVLAAFRPDVKARLVESGFLMPTVQMIFRASNKHLKPGEYLTGKAHPTAFDGEWVNPLKMVEMAHDLTVDSLPPLVRLKAIEEAPMRPGIDFFDPFPSERLGDTPQVIARVFRGKDLKRRIVVSAEDSRDLNGKSLAYEWKLLRGDPAGVKIVPQNAAKSVVAIEVEHPKRRPVSPGSPLESNRIDIGVFADNGQHWSAPGFVTWHGLDREARTYDDKGRVAEIAYASGEVRIGVVDWWKLLDAEFAEWFPPRSPAQSAVVAKLQKEKAEFDARVKKPAGDPAIETFLFGQYEKACKEFREKQRKDFESAFPGHRARLAELAKSSLVGDAKYRAAEAKASDAAKKALRSLIERTKDYDVRLDPAAKDRPIREGASAFDREFEELIGAERLNLIVFPGCLETRRVVNYADPRLTTAKTWRDVYLYDAASVCVGWARTQPDAKETAHFTADGLLVVDRDELGRCRTAKDVSFTIDPLGNEIPKMTWSPGKKTLEYEYAGPDDRRGRIKR